MDVLFIPQLDEVDASGEGGANARYRLLKRTPEKNTVFLTDRAVTRIELATGDPVKLVVPPEVKGQVRDFFVRIVITADEVPEITFAAPAGETISIEDADEDALKCEVGSNVFAFTETDSGIFMVNRKQIDIDVEIEFDPCGGELKKTKETYKLGAQYSSLPVPVLTGMVFQGWFTAPDGGVQVKASDRCKTGVTKLYAQWAVYVDPFQDAINPAKNLTFHTSGDAEWFVDMETFHSEGGSARSGGISHEQNDSLTTLVSGPGTISFFWKVSSETSYDKLQLYVDGECVVDDFSGDRGWEECSYWVGGAGTHSIEWRYSKDGSVSDGQDCGWVDDVVWTPEGGE
jgi:hypothetical protein